MSKVDMIDDLFARIPVGKQLSQEEFEKLCKTVGLVPPDKQMTSLDRNNLRRSITPHGKTVGVKLLSIARGWLQCYRLIEAHARAVYPRKALGLLKTYNVEQAHDLEIMVNTNQISDRAATKMEALNQLTILMVENLEKHIELIEIYKAKLLEDK